MRRMFLLVVGTLLVAACQSASQSASPNPVMECGDARWKQMLSTMSLAQDKEGGLCDALHTYNAGRASALRIEDPAARQQALSSWDADMQKILAGIVGSSNVARAMTFFRGDAP